MQSLPSPTLSGEESSMEDQPNLKQFMELMAQTQIQMRQMRMLQMELANIKAAMTGTEPESTSLISQVQVSRMMDA